MKKILFLALHLGYGGAERAIVSEANMLAERYEVEIACAYKLYDKPAFPVDQRVKVIYLSETLRPNKDELNQAIRSKNVVGIVKEAITSLRVLKHRIFSMKKVIRATDADVIISTRYLFNALLGKNKRPGVITIAQEHNHHNNDETYIQKMITSLKNIDYFMPVSRELTDFYAKRLTDTKCVYIPHSLEYIPENCSSLTEPRLVSVGRLSWEKGYVDLIEIFAQIAKEYPNWQLHIVGDGDERPRLEDAIARNQLEKQITLHGYRDKAYINRMLADSSVYVMTSFSESFGIVLIEAQSFGIPCVAFDSARGAVEIIEHDVNGYLISERNMGNMCETLKKLMDSHELRLRLGKKGRENSLQYAAENIQKQWFALMETM